MKITCLAKDFTVIIISHVHDISTKAIIYSRSFVYLFILFVVSFHLSLLDDNLQTEDLDEKNLFSRGSRRLPELRLVLLGERETGKSSAGNAILGGPGYFQSGEATEECLRQQTEVSNRLVTVVDVPGWEGGPEGLTPERVKREIGLSVTLCPPGPHAFLLALRVDAIIQAQAVREHLELWERQFGDIRFFVHEG